MKSVKELTKLDRLIADAVIGIDTLWGGDVMHPSGTGRFIADSWFSGAPLPAAYTHGTAAKLRETGGVGAKKPDRPAIESYLTAVDVRGAIQGMADQLKTLPPQRGSYLKGLVPCFEVMWDLAMERLGRGKRFPTNGVSAHPQVEPLSLRTPPQSANACGNSSTNQGTPPREAPSCAPRWTPGARNARSRQARSLR